jgi:hypothetical protein
MTSPAASAPPASTVHGMLFVASSVDAAHADDFNAWYDREHVEERVRIDGFLSGARYQRTGGAPQWPDYLGLYRTRSLGVFTSDAYRAAFGRQTPWSVANLDRMRDPMRRVCAVEAPTGSGTGSRLAILPLAPADDRAALVARAAEAGRALAAQPGFVQSYLLVPDAALSTPLPKESTAGRVLRPLMVVETSHDAGHRDALSLAAGLLQADAAAAAHYALGWKLGIADLG